MKLPEISYNVLYMNAWHHFFISTVQILKQLLMWAHVKRMIPFMILPYVHPTHWPLTVITLPQLSLTLESHEDRRHGGHPNNLCLCSTLQTTIITGIMVIYIS